MKDLKDVSSWKITARDMSDSRIHTQLVSNMFVPILKGNHLLNKYFHVWNDMK